MVLLGALNTVYSINIKVVVSAMINVVSLLIVCYLEMAAGISHNMAVGLETWLSSVGKHQNIVLYNICSVSE